MATYTAETTHAGEFIVSEGNGGISRGEVTILSGEDLAAGTVIAKVTASGKYVQHDEDGDDGSENAAGILFDAVDASSADVTEAVAILRLAEVNDGELVWPSTIEAAEKTAAIVELTALNIIVRGA